MCCGASIVGVDALQLKSFYTVPKKEAKLKCRTANAKPKPSSYKIKIFKDNSNKVGINALYNRLYVLNDEIPLSWLNLSRDP